MHFNSSEKKKLKKKNKIKKEKTRKIISREFKKVKKIEMYYKNKNKNEEYLLHLSQINKHFSPI